MATDDESDPTRSGSRWEPAPGAAPRPGDDASTDPASDPAATSVDQPAVPERAHRSWRERRLGFPVAAAVAAGLVVASGVGGFALGATTTGDDLTPVGVRAGDGDRFPGFPGLPGDDGDGDGPWHGIPGDPDREQVPPGFGDLTPPDLDGDDDDHGDVDGDDDDGSDDGDDDEDTGALT